MPTVTKTVVKPSTRKFGIEFEHINKLSIPQLAKVLRDNHIPVDGREGSSGREYSGWQVKGDGSITQQEKFPNGIELASPPSTIKDFPQFLKTLELVAKTGGVNSSCGLHVHVHTPELAATLAGRNVNKVWQEYVSQSWLAIEKIMFSYMPPSRRMSHYCRPGIQWSTKYQAINFSPLHDGRQTVEFRLHNATLNPVKAVAFAMLCRGIIEALSKQVKFPTKLEPTTKMHTKPQLIHTPRGGEFYLQRDKNGKWLIEAKKFKTEMEELPVAFKELKKELHLTGKDYLSAFHYPQYGNAMTELCELAGVTGMFRGYIEDRYERMLKKHGAADAKTQQQRLVPDEADFYHEPDYDPADEAAEQQRITRTAAARARLLRNNDEDDDEDRDEERGARY